LHRAQIVVAHHENKSFTPIAIETSELG
jgi:hypothetical protein